MSDDDFAVQRMLDGESEEDKDEPNDIDVELPSGAGVDLAVCRALPEATAPLREQRPNDRLAHSCSKQPCGKV